MPSRKSVSLPYPASANTTSASIPAGRGHAAPQLHARGHRLDALAIAGQRQSGAIGPESRTPVGVTERRRYRLDIGREP
jgi:hypothetical protein